MPLSVLVLTPDLTISELMHGMLESEGCTAYRPRDDERVAAALDRMRPDVALIDCDVWCDDDRLLQQIGERRIPAVLFSASRDHRYMRRAVRTGYSWFTLPISRFELVRLLRQQVATLDQSPSSGMDDRATSG